MPIEGAIDGGLCKVSFCTATKALVTPGKTSMTNPLIPLTADILKIILLQLLQNIFLHTTLFDTFECLAAADVVVGSESSMSEAAAAVSTNVKVMLWQGQIEQDRVTLNSSAVVSDGNVSMDAQREMNAAIANWAHCSGEAHQATGDGGGATTRAFYETVGGKSCFAA